MPKACIVVGTRPDIIKMCPVIKECEKQGLNYFVVHTGQHYDYNLDQLFFEQFELPKPKYNLGVGSGTYASEISKMMIGIERILLIEKPDIVLVLGDTNTCAAGGLTSAKCNIPIGHIEAGLRCNASMMLEEIDRVLVDHCSEYLFTPTEYSKAQLLKENIRDSRIFVTGNTVVDMVLKYSNNESDILNKLNLKTKGYILATVHRAENVDNGIRFTEIMTALRSISYNKKIPIIYPIHPRSKKMISAIGYDENNNIKIIEPIGYFDMLCLEKNALIIITDSGGLQEEACVLGVPCVTIRDNTERPESIYVGANILARINRENILECIDIMLKKDNKWDNPFGDGKSGERIVNIIKEIYG